ncbi:hypothetical protein FRC19_007087 [Serendipita sp. 401]|nr:hypothetical protein FRC19_007087 [Serendipita sp. 401]
MSAGGGSTAPPRHNQTGVPYNHQYHNSGSYNIPPQHTWPQGAATGRALPPPGPVIGASNPSSGTDGRGDPSTAQVMQQNWNPSIGNRSHSSQRRMHSPGNSSVSSFARTMSPDALIQHRIFSDESLWVGKDPPFASIQQVALTQQGPPTIPSTNRNEPDVIRKTYKGYVGRAPCDFVVIIKSINITGSVWGISVEYQAGGISRLLFEQIKVRLHCRLEDIRFIIYTVPIDSSIPYSNHRVRVWIKGLDGAHIRLFKSDEFRLGSQLAFEPLTHGPGHVVFATRDRSTPTIALHSSLLLSDSPKPSPSENRELSSTPGSGTVESIPDRELRAEAEYEQRRIGISVGIGGGARGSVSGGNLPFDESLPSYNAALGVGI